jgi:hypothetical protein
MKTKQDLIKEQKQKIQKREAKLLKALLKLKELENK